MHQALILKTKSLKGFSLVELSIVVIVIGILITGMMAGGNIVRAAKSSSIISELSYYKEGATKFQEIYKYIPGDMPPAIACASFGNTQAGLTCSGTLSTAGNNKIDDNTGSSYFENTLAFHQLYAAKLSSFAPKANYNAISNYAGDSFPPSSAYIKEGGGWAFIGKVEPVTGVYFTGVLRLGSGLTPLANSNSILGSGVVPVSIAADIDRKIDEPDSPLKGKIFVTGSGCFVGASITAYYPAENSTSLCTINYANEDSTFTGNANNQL
jgi:prepilin-type N-terminal cleavage/methylation domain-containing protein